MSRCQNEKMRGRPGSAKPAAMLRLTLLALLAATPALAAGAFDSDWSVSAKSQARLIADAQGAGFEIALAPGAITYWRDPGEAGVPPTFDFSGSVNLSKAEVEYPAPERIAEADGSTAFGYRANVILPIRITPADPAKPVRLSARVDYAVCDKLCVPAKATAELTLDGKGASPYAADLAAARARAPIKVAPAGLGAVVSTTGAKSWRLCLKAPPGDLFVEAPEGFWVQPKREADGRCYALSLQQAPDGAKPPIEVRVTIESASGARETRLTLGG
jgi:DsbC/DsbD-like thiol-disulfide interchange protein